ncbi:MAG TPA: hypothetical protein VGK33_15395 [Chloroflexota bacterium]
MPSTANILLGAQGFFGRTRYFDGMDISRALGLAAAVGDVELRRMYVSAVARGGSNTGCTAEEERVYGLARLVTLALIRASDLVLSAHLLDMVDEDGQDPLVARAASDVSAGALRLAHRALEIHSRDVGYDTEVWIERALLHTAAELDWRATGEHEGVPVALDEARSATMAIARASEASVSDRMLVPEQLAEALGHLLAIYALAKAAGG